MPRFVVLNRDDYLVEEVEDEQETKRDPSTRGEIHLSKGLPQEAACAEFSQQMIREGVREYASLMRQAMQDIRAQYNHGHERAREDVLEDTKALRNSLTNTDAIIGEALGARLAAVKHAEAVTLAAAKTAPREPFIRIGSLEELVANLAVLVSALRSNQTPQG
ncbi:MAG: hypothetical protein H6713_12150 [Myxococcales bacterium]|nr:hypothetical protein [Myxococcales bacterium]